MGRGRSEGSRRPGLRGSEKTEEDFVGCSGKFGSLREMRTLWRIIKIAGYQMVLMAQQPSYKKEKVLCFE